MITELLVAILLGLVVAAAVVAALARGILTTLAAFGAYSLGLAVVWLVFRAPDVALTEAAVGAGVTTALFLVVVARTIGFGVPQQQRQNSTPSSEFVDGDEATRVGDAGASEGTRLRTAVTGAVRQGRRRSVVVASLVTGGLLLTVPALPVVGAADTPGFGPVTEYYLTDSATRGIDNVVTAILVVYRGFDTFGEIAVVVTAVVAAVAVLNQGEER
ncbi:MULTISPECIES: hydrogen gas-evolving membrane-bound hydrogenase subunit E [Haloferax]|uniref:DUF4040 domain-containing protein n=1 Tax=Haloferax marinum TaxID=2666143 RepID=A0A6A8G8J0_9EURY|nr:MULTISPECIES: hydrogen gas-evolving membrane-bound hydrogenase subunit E [Haloferax]KAB1197855.1 DUF4040 domain-containing protein [Haloferax sp. CBA1150]MRW96918.1 DUF4040 domain-containing protein [Haloferax marinum]